jgi:transcription elongation factor GreB
MSRKIYITPEGAQKLREELERLWNVERRVVTREVAAAAAQGDRSENAEYIYGKKRLREIDRRVHFLRKRLDEVVVVKSGEVGDRERVFFGARVALEDAAGGRRDYRLVGPDEIDAVRGHISIDSPLGRALVGKRCGDEVSVERPSGPAVYTVLDVVYDGAASGEL